jgi:hypothetical protein
VDYAVDGAVAIRARREEILPWLVEPERMARWMVGVDSIEPAGEGAVRLQASAGIYAGWTFVGETESPAPNRLVRRYRLESGRAGVLPVGGDEPYERTVRYDLVATDGGAIEVRCTATTVIPGLARAAARAGARAEQRTLDRSLDRLRDVAEGRRPGLLRRLRDSSATPAPL